MFPWLPSQNILAKSISNQFEHNSQASNMPEENVEEIQISSDEDSIEMIGIDDDSFNSSINSTRSIDSPPPNKKFKGSDDDEEDSEDLPTIIDYKRCDICKIILGKSNLKYELFWNDTTLF